MRKPLGEDPEVPSIEQSGTDCGHSGDAAVPHQRRLERLIDRLPRRLRRLVQWLRKPSSRWLRIPVGVLLCIGGMLSILPLLGLWMLPLGLLLLAEDVPALGRAADRVLAWGERRWPRWLGRAPGPTGNRPEPPPRRGLDR